MPTHYEVLGVHPTCEQEVIDAAYKALVRKYHPDRAGDNEQIRNINAAYSILKSPIKRRAYDAMMKLFPSREVTLQQPDQAKHRARSNAQGSAPGRQEKNCPDCLENVAQGAQVCRHCGHRFKNAGWLTERGKHGGCILLVALTLVLSMYVMGFVTSVPSNDVVDVGPTAEVTPVEMPSAFQGRWADTIEECDSGALTVTEHGMGIEEPATLVEVDDQGRGKFVMTFERGEAERFTQTWQAQHGGAGMTVQGDGFVTEYENCPSLGVANLKTEGEGDDNPRTVRISAPTVPVIYRGRWALRAEDCLVPNGAKMITEAGDMGRSAGDLVAFSPISASSAELTFSMADDQGPFNYTERWTISPDRSSLIVDSMADGGRAQYIRCKN